MRHRAPHQSGRRRPYPRVNADGRWFGQGPQADDAVSGWKFPKRQMVGQRGGLVSADPKDESYDFPKEW